MTYYSSPDHLPQASLSADAWWRVKESTWRKLIAFDVLGVILTKDIRFDWSHMSELQWRDADGVVHECVVEPRTSEEALDAYESQTRGTINLPDDPQAMLDHIKRERLSQPESNPPVSAKSQEEQDEEAFETWHEAKGSTLVAAEADTWPYDKEYKRMAWHAALAYARQPTGYHVQFLLDARDQRIAELRKELEEVAETSEKVLNAQAEYVNQAIHGTIPPIHATAAVQVWEYTESLRTQLAEAQRDTAGEAGLDGEQLSQPSGKPQHGALRRNPCDKGNPFVVIHDLRAQLDEAQRITAMLDWLEEELKKWRTGMLHAKAPSKLPKWLWFVEADGRCIKADSLREALSEAMTATEERNS